MARARSLLADAGPSPELGWLCVHEAEKLIVAGHVVRARELGTEATGLGKQFGSVDLEMMGTATVGLAAVTEGDLDGGIARLGEAATAALGGELTPRWAIGWCCCYLIYACELARDYDRVAQWCQELQAWSERRGIEFLNRSCRAHYAGVLIWRGTCRRPRASSSSRPHGSPGSARPMAVEAQVRLGELRRRQGRLEEAAAMFARATEHPLAILGIGELSMDSEDAAGARDRAQECLRRGTGRGGDGPGLCPRAAGPGRDRPGRPRGGRRRARGDIGTGAS